MPRHSQAASALTRENILHQATQLGSIHGLEPLSIGMLAKASGVSRSGVMGHFADKESLQLATVQAAVDSFTAEVWAGVAGVTPGLDRLTAAMRAWLSYLERRVFPGGCFLTAASLEYDGRPGAVRDAVAAALERWLAVLEQDVTQAQELGQLPAAERPEQIVFELHAYIMACNWGMQLLDSGDALPAARAAIGRRLGVPASAL